jgi:hypothetical protein
MQVRPICVTMNCNTRCDSQARSGLGTGCLASTVLGRADCLCGEHTARRLGGRRDDCEGGIQQVQVSKQQGAAEGSGRVQTTTRAGTGKCSVQRPRVSRSSVTYVGLRQMQRPGHAQQRRVLTSKRDGGSGGAQDRLGYYPQTIRSYISCTVQRKNINNTKRIHNKESAIISVPPNKG